MRIAAKLEELRREYFPNDPAATSVLDLKTAMPGSYSFAPVAVPRPVQERL
jgi:hypothetical protein